jgi:hypothetical protein
MNEGKIFLFQQSHRKFFLVHRTKIIKKFSLFARQKSSKIFPHSQGGDWRTTTKNPWLLKPGILS